jgi:hypothetical protein
MHLKVVLALPNPTNNYSPLDLADSPSRPVAEQNIRYPSLGKSWTPSFFCSALWARDP